MNEDKETTLTHSDLIKYIRKIEIKTSRIVNNYFSGNYHSAFKGRGVEFDEVKAYVAGDDTRSMDWKVTARYRTPFVKKFKEERELNVMLLLDFSASNNFGSSKIKKHLIIELAAVFAFSAIKNNDKVGMIIFTDKPEIFIPPKKGRKHTLKIIHEIIKYKPKNKGTNIKSALIYLNRVIKRRSIVFLITDFCSDIPIKEINISKKRHDLIACFVDDKLEYNLPDINATIVLEDLEHENTVFINANDKSILYAFSKEQEKYKNDKLKLIKKHSIKHIIFDTDKDYIPNIIKFFKSHN